MKLSKSVALISAVAFSLATVGVNGSTASPFTRLPTSALMSQVGDQSMVQEIRQHRKITSAVTIMNAAIRGEITDLVNTDDLVATGLTMAVSGTQFHSGLDHLSLSLVNTIDVKSGAAYATVIGARDQIIVDAYDTINAGR